MSSHSSSCPNDIKQNQNWYIHQSENVSSMRSVRLLNNNWINAKYRQMAFWSPSDGAPISPNQPFFGIPGQTKVSGDRQRETTHEICCLAAELTLLHTDLKIMLMQGWGGAVNSSNWQQIQISFPFFVSVVFTNGYQSDKMNCLLLTF